MGRIKYIKIIKKWAKLRHSDPKFCDIAIRLYETSDERDKKLMLSEYQDYISGVKNGTIIPSMPTIPIRIFKKNGSST